MASGELWNMRDVSTVYRILLKDENLPTFTSAGAGGVGEDELGSLFVVEVAVSCSTAFRLGEGLRGLSCCDSRVVAAAFGEEAAVGGGLALLTVGSVLIGLLSGGDCTIQASHCSGPGSSVIKCLHALHAVHRVSRKSDKPLFPFCRIYAGILTVKFFPAAVTICTSPSRPNRSGESWE